MKKWLVVLAIVLISATGLWNYAKSTSSQLFGAIADRVETPEKVVALTFDDGPTRGFTQEILQILREQNVNATFFLTGVDIEKNPDAAQQIVKAGHEVGNHSYSHQRMLFKGTGFVADELQRTDALIRKAGFKGPIHFRPPYGKKLYTLPRYLAEQEITSITWDVAPESYGDDMGDSQGVVDRVMNQVRPGSIVLLHVMFESRASSMEAVPEIIHGLREKGYRFVTVSELLQYRDPESLGLYYKKKNYDGEDVPGFAENRHLLPKPIFDERPDYIDFYYKAWEIGFNHFKKPQATSPFVSNFIDEAFNGNIFLWDMSFSTMWGNYAHHVFPGIAGLDNFYITQMSDGEIVREIGEEDGQLGVAGWSEPGTEGNLNHPMLAWAELESYRITSDRQRIANVYEPLRRYRESYSKIFHEPSELYRTDKAAMDDSPRNDAMCCGIDVAAEMVIFDRWLADMATILGRSGEAKDYLERAKDYAAFINEKLWDEETGFYYDWGKDGQRMDMRTIAAFWTLLGLIPDKAQLERLVKHLNDPASFNTPHRVPTHPVNETGFNGDYWAGGVWAPTNTAIIQGLELNGEFALAREIALNHLDGATEVFRSTGTAWENYYPLELIAGRKAKPDFVGWSGLAPINYLIRHAIGIRVDAPENTITWRINETGRHGIEGLRMGTPDGGWNVVSLVAEARENSGDTPVIHYSCEQPLTLKLQVNGQWASYQLDCSRAGNLDTTVAPGKPVTLRDTFANDFLVGAALGREQIMNKQPGKLEMVAQQFSAVTPENVMKWEKIEPLEGQFDFEAADALVEFAEVNNMSVAGHVLVWHQQTPSWVFEDEQGKPASRELLLQRMENHITAVVGRYKGRIQSWEVVNEALNEDGSLRNTPWFEIIGADYLEKAFEFARRADPDAELYYNDYNLFSPEKRNGAVQLVKRLQGKGLTVHGIGMQGHYGLDNPEDVQQFEDSIIAFSELGSVYITEMDVSVLPFPEQEQWGADISLDLALQDEFNPFADGLPAETERAQSRHYVDLFRIMLKHRDKLSRVTFWGVSDHDSWKNNWPMQGRTDYPLLFDREDRPKPVFYDIIGLVD